MLTPSSWLGIYYKKRQEVGENNFVALLFPAIQPFLSKERSKEDPTKHSEKDLPSQAKRSPSCRPILPYNQDSDIMLTRQEGKMIKQEQGECESVQSNQSVEFQYLTAKNYEELIHSHQLAKTFISELGQARRTPVCDSLLAYVKEMRFSFKSGDFIMELMESRLNKMIKNNKIKKNWSEEDLQILVWFLSKYMGRNGIESHQAMTKTDWERLSALIPGSTARSCMFKFVSLKKFKLAQHKWSKEEDSLMHKIIAEIGTKSWKAISERLYEESSKKKIYRTAKQCREHWSCYLDPRIKKGPWDQDEDKKLLQIVLESQCQKKWSIIKQQFQGRTENALKNRYNLLLEKQKKITPMDKEADIINEILKEDKDETSQQQEPSEKEKEKAHKNVIAIPQPIYRGEERRSNEIFSPSYIILFNNAGDGKLPSLPLNTWFFQM